MSKLTMAQVYALETLDRCYPECGSCHAGTARALHSRGLIERWPYSRYFGWWVITPAGRAALEQYNGQPT